jgi:hypothetical protein
MLEASRFRIAAVWERVIVWLLFGVGLSLTPLLIVAAMGWSPSNGTQGLLRLLCNEELLAIALTLGGAAAADVLTRSSGRFRLLKLFMGGVTFRGIALEIRLCEIGLARRGDAGFYP